MAGAKRVDCILLGAGVSARMGVPKLLVSVRGRRVLEIVLANHAASSLGSICAVVPGWLPEFHEIARRHASERVSFLEMDRPCVMSESLRSGWRWVEDHWGPDAVMISLADKPLVGSDTIDLLLRSYRPGDDGILVPTYRGRRGHPVILSSQLGKEVMALEGDRGAVEVLAAHPDLVHELDVDSDEVIFDIDSPADVAVLRARLDSDGRRRTGP